MTRGFKQNSQHTITATEVAEFMYCAKAWQLKREGVEAESSQLAFGTAYHRTHGKQISFARKLQRAGWALVALVLFLMVLWLWGWR